MKQEARTIVVEQERGQCDQGAIPLTMSEFETKLKEIGAEILKPSETSNSEVLPMAIHHDPIAVKDGKVVAFWIK
jgi:hypothetical protein